MLFESLADPLVPPPDDLTIPQFILDEVLQHPTYAKRSDKIPCLIDEESGRSVGLPELRLRSDALARSLAKTYGIKRGDTVALVLPNHIDYPVCVWAILRLGATVAAIAPTLTVNEYGPQFHISKPSLIIAYFENFDIVGSAAHSLGLKESRVLVLDGELAPSSHSKAKLMRSQSIATAVTKGSKLPKYEEREFKAGEAKTEVAFLCFSSGTTGQPKAVAISHYNVMCNVLQTATFNKINQDYAPLAERRFRPGDVCTGVLPFYHIYGLVTNMHYLIFASMTIVVTRKFVFEKFLESITKYRISHLQIVPPMAVLLCKHPATPKHDISSVRYCMIAAAPISAELTTELLTVLPNIHLGQGYGMTESCAAVSMFPLAKKVATLGSAGQLVSGTVAKVVKPDGSLAGYGEPGELWVKGGQIVLGYLENDDATKESFVDGWYRTGDEVIFRENGDIFVTDRIKELIKTKGFQVAPAELEGHLLSHADVADAGVIGIADDYAGEVPLAFIALKAETAVKISKDHSGITEKKVKESIFKHVSAAKSSYKQLTGGIEFIEAIPKSSSGKILRRVLRDRARTTLQKNEVFHAKAKL